MKVTLTNLVPCERETWAFAKPAHDLTNNLVHAEKFILAAIRFFKISRGTVRFSGFVSPGKDGLQIKLWDGQQLFRVIRFRVPGFTAVLHVVPDGQPVKACLGQDLVGDLNAETCLCGYS